MFIGIVAAAPLFSNAGLLNTRGGGDSPFLLQRLQQLTTALGDGHFPVRWMPDANYGYGYPFYNYYAPLSIYVAAVFRLLGAGYVLAVKGAQLAGFLVAAWAMFSLVRRWLGNDWAGLLAAAAYTLAPFHMVNVYVRGDSLAEFWAMAFYPLVVLAIDRLTGEALGRNGGRARRLGLASLALAYGALILSHNISALIFTPFLLLYLLLMAWDGKEAPAVEAADDDTEGQPASERTGPVTRARPLISVGLALLLALALSAWFWVPALAESSLAQLEPVTEGYFHFSNHFRDGDLVQRTFVFDYDPAGGRAFSMGLAQALAILLGTTALLIVGSRSPNGVRRGRRIFIVSGLLLATLMITSLSLWLWDNLPLLSFTQFPWRFLSVQAFFGALATGGLALLPGRRAIVPAAIGLLLLSALAGLQLDFLKLADSDVTPERLAGYEWYSGNIGTTVSAEYLPESVQPRPRTSPWLNLGQRDAARPLEGELLATEFLERRTAGQVWRIVAGDEGVTVSLPTMVWPGWRATLNGEPLALESAGSSGLMALRLPPGEHRVELVLGRTPARLGAEIVALAALLVCGWLVVTGVKVRRPGRRVLAAVAGLALLLVALRLWPTADARGDDLNWDFAQMAYLHHVDEGVDFENGARLTGYRYDADEVTAGETLQVTLAWAPGAAGQARLELVTPAANRSVRPPALAHQSQALGPGPVTYELAIPENAPAGLVMPRLIVEGTQPLTPSGLTRGDLSLRPLLLRDRPQPAGDGLALLDARAIKAALRDDRVLELQLQWLTRRPLGDNYNYSLRLVDADGREVAQLDDQPGFGFLPSSGWTANHWTDDWIGMAWSEEAAAAAAEGPLDIVIRLYDVSDGRVVLTRLLGQLAWHESDLAFAPLERFFALPAAATPVTAGFGPTDSGATIDLAGYELDQSGDALNLALYWTTADEVAEELYHFVHLEDVSGEIVAQHDGMPRRNTYPTSQWAAGEVVADALQISLDQLPAGDYKLHVGLYRLQDGQAFRLPITGAGQLPAAGDRLSLPDTISIGR